MYLLDTNALLFFLYESEKLSEKASEIIYKDSSDIGVSVVSLWEIAIKSSIGKLKIKNTISEIAEVCEKENMHLLPIKTEYLDYISKLPDIHSDPFDRLLISQAIVDEMTIISKDRIMPQYDVDVLW